MMQSTRPWHEGPPPFVGWWQASTTGDRGTWRWWDGFRWSRAAYPQMTAEQAARQAALQLPRGLSQQVCWTWEWPERGRVRREKPKLRTLPVGESRSLWPAGAARLWRTGYPDASDWYNAATRPREDLWRWFDHQTNRWSVAVHESATAEEAAQLARLPSRETLPIRWTTRRPHNRRRHLRAKAAVRVLLAR